MALLTGGTAATTTLKALKVDGAMGAGSSKAADVAAWNAYAKAQSAAAGADYTTAFTLTGLLYLPGKRGVIQCIPGDYIMIDPTSGWPIVVTAQAVTGGGFVHS
jgi:hypothetical protein